MSPKQPQQAYQQVSTGSGKELHRAPWVVATAIRMTTTFNTQNLRGQLLLFRCLETGFVTTAPALTRYQQGRGIDPSRRELVGERSPHWHKQTPVTICEHCGMVVKGNQWAFRQHQQTKRCRRAQQDT